MTNTRTTTFNASAHNKRHWASTARNRLLKLVYQTGDWYQHAMLPIVTWRSDLALIADVLSSQVLVELPHQSGCHPVNG